MSHLICSGCKDIFAGSKSVTSQRIASALAPLMECTQCDSEALSTSAYSPGIVASEEELAVCACHPNHILDDGTLSFNIVDAAYLHGMSVTRIAHSAGGEVGVQAFCAAIFPGPTEKKKRAKRADGIAVFLASDARNIKHGDGTRAYKVYDTANESLTAHADVVATNYFGLMEALPVEEQGIRTQAQWNLVEKMSLKMRELLV